MPTSDVRPYDVDVFKLAIYTYILSNTSDLVGFTLTEHMKKITPRESTLEGDISWPLMTANNVILGTVCSVDKAFNISTGYFLWESVPLKGSDPTGPKAVNLKAAVTPTTPIYDISSGKQV